MKFTKFNFLLALTAGLVLLFSGCKKDDDLDPPPPDSAPQIMITSPTVPYALARTGDVLYIKFEAHDNEQLNFFKITEKRMDPSGVVYMPETQILITALSTQDHTNNYMYTVPATPLYYCSIELKGYAIDNKGRTVSVKFVIAVIPPAGTIDNDSIQSYDSPEGDTIWMDYTGSNGGGHNFDIYNRQHGDDTQIITLNRHLSEVSPTFAGPVGAFTSPYWASVDSVLVLTNSSIFDFDNLTWETTWQAFMSSNQLGDQAGPSIQADDIVILKLQNPQPNSLPNYAVFKILGVELDAVNAANNFIRFNYKYTY